METEQEIDILPVDEQGEEDVMITCIGCKELRGVRVEPTLHDIGRMQRTDVLRGNLFCPECKVWTAFEMTGSHTTYIESPGVYGPLDENLNQGIKEVFQEAVLSFQATAYRASATMRRAGVEDMLVNKGFQRGRLERKINAAKRKGALDQRLVMLAHGARLVGNDAVHIKREIKASEIPPLLTATTTLLNHLFAWQP